MHVDFPPFGLSPVREVADQEPMGSVRHGRHGRGRARQSTKRWQMAGARRGNLQSGSTYVLGIVTPSFASDGALVPIPVRTASTTASACS